MIGKLLGNGKEIVGKCAGNGWEMTWKLLGSGKEMLRKCSGNGWEMLPFPDEILSISPFDPSEAPGSFLEQMDEKFAKVPRLSILTLLTSSLNRPKSTSSWCTFTFQVVHRHVGNFVVPDQRHR